MVVCFDKIRWEKSFLSRVIYFLSLPRDVGIALISSWDYGVPWRQLGVGLGVTTPIASIRCYGGFSSLALSWYLLAGSRARVHWVSSPKHIIIMCTEYVSTYISTNHDY